MFEQLNRDKNETLAIPVHSLVISKFANEKARSFFFGRVYIKLSDFHSVKSHWNVEMSSL